jgi:DNA phosphorothioation-dependent restriction protein DptG
MLKHYIVRLLKLTTDIKYIGSSNIFQFRLNDFQEASSNSKPIYFISIVDFNSVTL